MASTPLASPSRRYHPTSSPFFDSPGDSSVIFGAGGSLSPSKANILTPTSRRETLILPQGFAGRGKSLVVDSPSAVTNNSEPHLLLNSSSRRRGRSASPTKGCFHSPLVPQRATPRSTRSSASSSKSSPDKENPTPRRSSRRQAASSTSTLDDLSTASPSRSLRFSGTPKSARRAQTDEPAFEEPATPVHVEQEPQSPMLSERVMLAAEDDAEEYTVEEAGAVYEDYAAMLQYDEGQEQASEPLDLAYSSDGTLPDSPPLETYPLPPANLTIRHALSYDSDELTDTDAEGSYEIFSDDEVDQNAQFDDDEDAQDVLSQLQELRVESAAPSPAAFVEEQEDETVEQEEVEEEEGSGSELESEELGHSSGLEGVETEVEEEEVDAEKPAQVEDAATKEEAIATPVTDLVEDEVLDVEEPDEEPLVEEQPVQVEDAREKQMERDYQRALEEQLRPPSPFVSSAQVDSPPAASPIRNSPVALPNNPTRATPRRSPFKPAPTPLVSAVTPVRPPSATPSRAAKASSTPSATSAKRQPVLAAPTARRQLTKLTSKPAVRPTASATDAGKVLSGIVPSLAAPGQRRLGLAKSTLPVRSSPPPSSTLSRTTGIPKSTAPLPSTSSLASASALPTPSIARSKLAGPLKSSVAPSKMAPPLSTASRTLAPSRMMAPTARRTALAADGRPGSAASNSSGTSAPTSTLPRPRPAIAKSLKPASAPTTSTAPSLARPTAATGVARRGLAAPTLSSSARTGITPSPHPPSSTSSLATRAPLPASATAQAAAAPTGLLPRPPSAPPSALPSSRLLPALAPTHSAPSVLSSEARPTPSPAPSPLPVQPTLPLLPRPAPLNPTPRSPEKRSAQRVVREVPADRLTKSDLENIAPRQLAANGSSSSLASQSTAPRLHRTALGATLSLPAISTFPPISPVEQTRITAVAPFLPATTKVEQPSLLTAAPEKVDAEIVAVLFGAPPAQELLPAATRSTRARRTKVTTKLVEPEPTSAPVVEPLPLLPRPTRRARVVEVVEAPADEPSPEAAPPAIVRPPITFNPAPALTQEELNRLTQKNTKRNQLHFNKHDVQTIIMDVNRPPSPTSKIRRSISKEGAAGRPTTKEGREARAANRRRALRSSTDGSELELMKNELGAGEEEEQKEPVVHYRAPGDDEEFFSPVRTSKVLKGKKKDSMAAELVLKTVKWDKALVYEGPLDGKNSRADPIIRRTPLDAFGNSTNTATGFAKPAPVQIKKLVYRDDD